MALTIGLFLREGKHMQAHSIIIACYPVLQEFLQMV
jgi:hypothetical protein